MKRRKPWESTYPVGSRIEKVPSAELYDPSAILDKAVLEIMDEAVGKFADSFMGYWTADMAAAGSMTGRWRPDYESVLEVRPRGARIPLPRLPEYSEVQGVYVGDQPGMYGKIAIIRFLLSGAFGIQPGEKCEANFSDGWGEFMMQDFVFQEEDT